MKITRLCMLILIVIVKTIHTTEVFINFLLENSELCGDPWQMQTLPVIGLCTAGCREGLDVCMEDENLRQRCKRLPLPCVKLYAEHTKILLKKSTAEQSMRLASQNLDIPNNKSPLKDISPPYHNQKLINPINNGNNNKWLVNKKVSIASRPLHNNNKKNTVRQVSQFRGNIPTNSGTEFQRNINQNNAKSINTVNARTKFRNSKGNVISQQKNINTNIPNNQKKWVPQSHLPFQNNNSFSQNKFVEKPSTSAGKGIFRKVQITHMQFQPRAQAQTGNIRQVVG